MHKNNFLNWLLTSETVVLYMTGWANTKPLLVLLPTSQWWCACTKGIDCYLLSILSIVTVVDPGERPRWQSTHIVRYWQTTPWKRVQGNRSPNKGHIGQEMARKFGPLCLVQVSNFFLQVAKIYEFSIPLLDP